MENKKREKLEDLLLKFVERAVNEPKSEKEIEVLPQVAHVLKELLD